MIGQTRLIERINSMTDFPRFTIIVGEENSGRKMIAKEIAKKLKANLIQSGTKVDDVREIIELSYKQDSPTVYLFADVDKMSLAAKNAMLKITEEPPRKAYFILTAVDLSNVLPTLQSRGTIFMLDRYSPEELLAYADLKQYELTNEEKHIITNICTTTGEVDLLVNYNIEEFYNFAKLVVRNIGEVSGANAFKIADKLKLKEIDEGYDLKLFLNVIMYLYRQLMNLKPLPEYKESIRITSKYLAETKIKSINKAFTIDMWILEMRGANA